MPDIERPDGAVIHYETFGAGYPLLCLAPGGVNSEIGFWQVSAINPLRELADEFLVIGMDQRHAGRSPAPAAPFSYGQAAADQLAVLDDLGLERAHAYGGCIGVAYILRLAREAPGRITAGVGQDPVGLDETNSTDTFMEMFKPTLALAREGGTAAVIEAALANPVFMANNAAGPFARRLHDDAAFRAEVEGLGADGYAALIEAFADGIWPDRAPYFSVDEADVRACATPLLILPGSDPFHPTGVAERICREAPDARCLPVGCRDEANLAETTAGIRRFLRERTP